MFPDLFSEFKNCPSVNSLVLRYGWYLALNIDMHASYFPTVISLFLSFILLLYRLPNTLSFFLPSSILGILFSLAKSFLLLSSSNYFYIIIEFIYLTYFYQFLYISLWCHTDESYFCSIILYKLNYFFYPCWLSIIMISPHDLLISL